MATFLMAPTIWAMNIGSLVVSHVFALVADDGVTSTNPPPGASASRRQPEPGPFQHVLPGAECRLAEQLRRRGLRRAVCVDDERGGLAHVEVLRRVEQILPRAKHAGLGVAGGEGRRAVHAGRDDLGACGSRLGAGASVRRRSFRAGRRHRLRGRSSSACRSCSLPTSSRNCPDRPHCRFPHPTTSRRFRRHTVQPGPRVVALPPAPPSSRNRSRDTSTQRSGRTSDSAHDVEKSRAPRHDAHSPRLPASAYVPHAEMRGLAGGVTSVSRVRRGANDRSARPRSRRGHRPQFQAFAGMSAITA